MQPVSFSLSKKEGLLRNEEHHFIAISD
uniref:Uncharacterized protein n=1 Tax=Lepeophtheirus salmonis TaxID=72036 RepID=A0A0K2TB50_LEPSM